MASSQLLWIRNVVCFGLLCTATQVVAKVINVDTGQRDPVVSIDVTSPGNTNRDKVPASTARENAISDDFRQADTLSLVVDQTGSKGGEDYIKFIDPPRTITIFHPIIVEYQCSRPAQIGVDLTISTSLQNNYVAYRHHWSCEYLNKPLRKTFTLRNHKMPPSVAYRPDHHNLISIVTMRSNMKLWLLENGIFEKYGSKLAYKLARSKVSSAVHMSDPYDRPERPITKCDSWWREVKTRGPYTPQCPYEREVYPLVTFPVALPGGLTGVHRQMPEYGNKVLRSIRKEDMTSPRFTISVWLYVMDYCPMAWRLCSIVQRLTWDDFYMTPLVFVNSAGQLHLQSMTEDKTPIAYLTGIRLPLDQWIHLVVTFNRMRWELTVEYGENWSLRLEDAFDVNSWHKPYNDDTEGSFVVGGTEITPSFKGFIGKATYWRRKVLIPEQIPRPDPYHPMFELKLAEREQKCTDFMRLVRHTTYSAKLLLQAIIQTKSCSSHFRDFILGPEPILPTSWDTTCSLFGGGGHVTHQAAITWVRRQVLRGQELDLKTIGDSLYDNVTKVMEYSELEVLTEHLQTLREASCYGNHDAAYMLAVVLNDGLGVKVQQIESHSYLLTTAVEGSHRLSLMALGNKHTHGLDGLEQDYEQAYPYYKYVADHHRLDRDKHSEDDVYVEMVRLTNEWQMNEQTDEDGHLFLWFKHQATQGVLDAQRTMGRLLFWGSQGVKRDLQAAAEYYRVGAESNDPGALFDYAIVRMRGQGVEANETEAYELLERSADMGHIPAINTLGWWALEKTKDYDMAFNYFNQAHLQKNPDAAHNLGHMFMNGFVPSLQGTPDKLKAWEFFSAGAVRGSLDSSVMVALYNMRGHPHAKRDPVNAVEWARFVAEQNPMIGKMLYKGLKAYRKEIWPESILYYMLAANSGLEVATFNIAYLCEENKNYMTSYIEKECIYRYYNMSTRRQFHFVDPYAWIKMGDYHWYGCGGKRDARQAARQYANAAYKRDPHAVFNLGFLVEQGSYVPESIWNNLGITKEAQSNNMTLLLEVYAKCKESSKSEAYLPCTLAYLNIQAQMYWNDYHVFVKIGSALLAMALCALMGNSLMSFFRQGGAMVQV